MSSVPARCAGWFATIPTLLPAEPREADDDVLREVAVHFEERAVVGHRVHEIVHVVRLIRRLGHERVERRIFTIHRIRRLARAAHRPGCWREDSRAAPE